MLYYIIKRLLLMIPTLFGVMLISFIITQFVPGGPVEQLIGELEGNMLMGEISSGFYQGDRGLEAEQIEALRALYGFDKPAYERFIMMLQQYLLFDFGDSFMHAAPVIEVIQSKLPVSISLGAWTFMLTYLICIPLGIAKAVRDGSAFDVVTSSLILVGYAIPNFVLGLVLLVLFGGGSFWDIFPLRGIVSDNWQQLTPIEQVLDYLWHMVLPVTALMVSSLAMMTLLTKNSFVEEIRKQYVLTARAKGLASRTVLYKHVFRNAILPVVAGFPSVFISVFFTGSLLVETIFSLDGLGLLSYNAIMQRNYPVVLGSLYIFTLIGLLAKLLTDIAYTWVDPRIKFDAIT